MKGFFMTEQEIKIFLDSITEENADTIIKLYNKYIDDKFMEESRKGAFQTLAYLKKEYSIMIKIHQGLSIYLLFSFIVDENSTLKSLISDVGI